jgi:hypothetical protein
VLVGGVEQHGVAGVAALYDEDVVVIGADDDLVHLGVGVGPVERAGDVDHGIDPTGRGRRRPLLPGRRLSIVG